MVYVILGGLLVFAVLYKKEIYVYIYIYIIINSMYFYI